MPLKPHLVKGVNVIEVAEIEVSHSLLIRRVNPLFLAMGSSGLVLDAAVVANHAYRYEKRAGPVHQMGIALFKATLMKSLSQNGFQVTASGKRFWDYFKPSQKQWREVTDAILHIRLEQMGFWSKAVDDGYYPSVLVVVELIDPVSRELLYSDRFSMGIDVTSVQVMAVAFGKTNVLPLDHHFTPYENFKALLSHPEQSRDDLMKVLSIAAHRISQGLQRPRSPAFQNFEPALLESMPAMPRSVYVGEGAHR